MEGVEGDEGGIFRKAPDWKSLFSLKIKVKKKLSTVQIGNTMQSSSTSHSSEYQGLSLK